MKIKKFPLTLTLLMAFSSSNLTICSENQGYFSWVTSAPQRVLQQVGSYSSSAAAYLYQQITSLVNKLSEHYKLVLLGTLAASLGYVIYKKKHQDMQPKQYINPGYSSSSESESELEPDNDSSVSASSLSGTEEEQNLPPKEYVPLKYYSSKSSSSSESASEHKDDNYNADDDNNNFNKDPEIIAFYAPSKLDSSFDDYRLAENRVIADLKDPIKELRTSAKTFADLTNQANIIINELEKKLTSLSVSNASDRVRSIYENWNNLKSEQTNPNLPTEVEVKIGNKLIPFPREIYINREKASLARSLLFAIMNESSQPYIRKRLEIVDKFLHLYAIMGLLQYYQNQLSTKPTEELTIKFEKLQKLKNLQLKSAGLTE